jgi:hypothetical protein
MHIHDRFPIVVAHLKEQIVAQHASIVDQDIQPAKRVNRLLNCRFYGFSLRDIAGNGESLRTRLLDLSGNLFAAFWINVSEHDARSIFGQAQRGGGTNTSTSSGDKGHAAIKFSHDKFLQNNYVNLLLLPVY